MNVQAKTVCAEIVVMLVLNALHLSNVLIADQDTSLITTTSVRVVTIFVVLVKWLENV